MTKQCVDRLIGQYCKIVTTEPGMEKGTVVTGYVQDIDHKNGFLVVESQHGVGCVNIKSIIAIKPRKTESFLL